jgi:serine phosphatase RsbU (regulator of sigma subunit)
MRRALIVAGDAAAASAAAIEQQSPLVSAIRGELAATPARDIPGLSIHGELHPAEGVLAGDWWDVVALPNDRAALLLVDVSGHGALAGLTALRLKTVMTVALRNGADPAGVLERAATELTDHDDGSFATAVVVLVDPSAGELSWANGGHPGPWVMRGGSPDRRETLDQTGPLLAAIGGSWATYSTGYGLGDVLLAWSDGFTEARSAEAELTDEALADVVRECGNVAPEELVARLVAAVRQDHVEWHRDDVTVVAIASVGEVRGPRSTDGAGQRC